MGLYVCVHIFSCKIEHFRGGLKTPPYPLAVPPVMIMTQEKVVSTRNEVKCVPEVCTELSFEGGGGCTI